ncbi:MAG: hypothetical protein H6709_23780, partial [Kofleriaceae bacterium]|nr:hypothetical protein [Kofleriaceae bacterium]
MAAGRRGARTRGKGGRPPGDEPAAAPASPLEIGLEHMRLRHAAWMVVCVTPGLLLVWKLGALGQAIGALLLVLGALAGYAFVRTLLFPPGTIVVAAAGVELPRGLCRGAPDKHPLSAVEHTYLLRRAVPWTRAAPVLVVEAAGRAYSYPRDWFLTEADQRRIVRELNARGAGRASLDAADGKPAADGA